MLVFTLEFNCRQSSKSLKHNCFDVFINSQVITRSPDITPQVNIIFSYLTQTKKWYVHVGHHSNFLQSQTLTKLTVKHQATRITNRKIT